MPCPMMCAFTALRCCVVRWALARCACPAAWHCGAGKGGGVGRAAVPTAELECRQSASFSRQALSQADRHWSCDACDREHRGSEERDRAGAAGGEAATWEPSSWPLPPSLPQALTAPTRSHGPLHHLQTPWQTLQSPHESR